MITSAGPRSVDALDRGRQRGERGADPALLGQRAVLDQGGRQRRRQAVLDQPGAQPVERLVAHVEDQGLARLAQGLPVQLGLAVLGVAGDQDQGLGVVAVGQRDDRARRRSRRRR